jgi:hypothetical protein
LLLASCSMLLASSSSLLASSLLSFGHFSSRFAELDLSLSVDTCLSLLAVAPLHASSQRSAVTSTSKQTVNVA